MVHHIAHGKISCGRTQSGITYVFFLWFILVYGILIGSYIEVTSTQSKRLKELDFLHTAQMYNNAIEQYYQDHQTLPSHAKQLVCDANSFPCNRYLREIYLDPLTGQQFTYLYDEQHLLVGVKSKSNEKIINHKIREDYNANHYDQLEFKIDYSSFKKM